jgi:predicted regulator of Ras-like GTPase activity (Roadblock/LC7/MglB family)
MNGTISESKLSALDARLFREIMTQIKGITGMLLVTREGVVVQSSFAESVNNMDLITSTNSLLSISEQILVRLNFQDFKTGIIQADDGFFLVLSFETDLYLVVLAHSTAPINVIMSQIQNILAKQLPRWRHD